MIYRSLPILISESKLNFIIIKVVTLQTVMNTWQSFCWILFRFEDLRFLSIFNCIRLETKFCRILLLTYGKKYDMT